MHTPYSHVHIPFTPTYAPTPSSPPSSTSGGQLLIFTKSCCRRVATQHYVQRPGGSLKLWERRRGGDDRCIIDTKKHLSLPSFRLSPPSFRPAHRACCNHEGTYGHSQACRHIQPVGGWGHIIKPTLTFNWFCTCSSLRATVTPSKMVLRGTSELGRRGRCPTHSIALHTWSAVASTTAFFHMCILPMQLKVKINKTKVYKVQKKTNNSDTL
jgi:hypothetical protein